MTTAYLQPLYKKKGKCVALGDGRLKSFEQGGLEFSDTLKPC